MLIYGYENLKIDEVIKSALLSHEKMEHDSGSRDNTAFGLVTRRTLMEIGLSSRGSVNLR